ncbi:MAG: NIPSNAP family protein, partial [Verrucomicrobiota bacterium]
LTGSSLPSLTYLLVFGSLADRERHWTTFAADPEWKKLSSTPGFTDPEIVTNITSVLLRPTPYSPV